MDMVEIITAYEEARGCLHPRSTIAMIAVISLVGCLADTLSSGVIIRLSCPTKTFVDCARLLLMTLFQLANILLLLASITKKSFLVEIYVWYTLGFVILGFVVALAELLVNMESQGFRSFFIFAPEVIFLFTISRCLPLVNLYGQHLDTIGDTLQT